MLFLDAPNWFGSFWKYQYVLCLWHYGSNILVDGLLIAIGRWCWFSSSIDKPIFVHYISLFTFHWFRWYDMGCVVFVLCATHVWCPRKLCHNATLVILSFTQRSHRPIYDLKTKGCGFSLPMPCSSFSRSQSQIVAVRFPQTSRLVFQDRHEIMRMQQEIVQLRTEERLVFCCGREWVQLVAIYGPIRQCSLFSWVFGPVVAVSFVVQLMGLEPRNWPLTRGFRCCNTEVSPWLSATWIMGDRILQPLFLRIAQSLAHPKGLLSSPQFEINVH